MFFAKIPKKYAKNTRCCVVKGEMIHIYGKKGNNERENTGKAALIVVEKSLQSYRKRG